MKLEGIRVVDLSVFLPGPYLTMAMADYGAEVIKVERAEQGDPGRYIGEFDGETTAFFRNLNRGKKSIELNLQSAEGHAQLLRLLETADVFVETFRPGVMHHLGLDYATVRVQNPRIVYCSISAFGQDGPYRNRPAHDLVIEALTGAVGITLGADEGPALPGFAAADIVSSLQALSGILMALLRREATKQGDYVDVSMHASFLAAGPNVFGSALAENRQPIPKHERTNGGSAFYQIYETKDGRHVVLGGQELKFVRPFLDKLGRLDFVSLCERGPGPHQKPLIDFLRGVFKERTLEEWVGWTESLDVCFAPVNTLPEALADKNAVSLGMVLHDESGRRHLGPAIRFRDEPAQPNFRVPKLGEHNDALLRTKR
jgi:crotonobetainyl-CoA:carnitine CoA-transferase CaiB-like acyl-CoA transferase